MRSKDYMLMPGFTWPKISSGRIAMRRVPESFMFDVEGLSLFPSELAHGLAYEAFVSSSVASAFLALLSPTLNFEVGNVTAMPLLDAVTAKKNIAHLASQCNTLAEDFRDLSETSWEFRRYPLA